MQSYCIILQNVTVICVAWVVVPFDAVLRQNYASPLIVMCSGYFGICYDSERLLAEPYSRSTVGVSIVASKVAYVVVPLEVTAPQPVHVYVYVITRGE